MKALVLTVALGLLAALQAQDPLALLLPEGQNITGTWYVKAVVGSKALPEGMRPKKLFPLTVTALDDGSLEATIVFEKHGQCFEKKFVMRKTEQPGEYIALDGKKRTRVEGLSTSDHYVFFCEKQRLGRVFRMAKLMGRSPDPAPQATLEEFKELVQHKGFLPENIMVTPVQQERCVPAQE